MSAKSDDRWKRTLITVVIGAIGGATGYLSGLPAGAMLGAIVSVGAFGLLTDGAARVPRPLRIGGRILLGTAVGALITPAALVAVGANLAWALGFTAALIVVGLVCGLLFARWSGLDPRTALISFSPGGMPEMTALADEVGARTDVVVGVHLTRKILTLAVVTGCIIVLGLG